MAIINEVNDTDIYMSVGDTYNGGVAGSDTRDVMIFNGMQVGSSYTVTIDLTSIDDTVEVGILNLYAQGTRYFIIDGTLAPASVPDAGFASFSPGELNGTTLTFTITLAQPQVLGLEFNIHNGGSTNYSISLAEYVAPPAITEGADIILGDSNDNLIDALGGDDDVDGAEGNDTLDGGAGNDSLTGGTGGDTFLIGLAAGADVITDFTSGQDVIDMSAYGFNAIEDMTITDTPGGAVIDLGEGNQVTIQGVTADSLNNNDFVLVDNIVEGTLLDDSFLGKSGVDIMTGGEGDDALTGAGGNDQLDGGNGKDKLTGGDGNDLLIGGAGNDLLKGDDGQDTLSGGDNNDRLHGGDGADIIDGGAGNDKLYGDAGDDIIDGGTGKDILEGGSGSDTFVFVAGSHQDTIVDFQDGIDMLDFSGHSAVFEFADLSITQNGANVVINHGGNDAVTLNNVDILDIDATDFVF